MAEVDLAETDHEIRPIEPGSIHRISAGQGILDLAGAVKELVENSLDAGASKIDIVLHEYGADLIEVADNGPGVSPEYYQALTLKNYTSKILNFADLQRLSSFGFRGEALSSLCAMSRVTITTKTADDIVATRLEYDLSGLIVTRSCVARYVGTTVSVARLFYPFPVRRKEFQRNVRREYGKLITMLQAYALISKRVRFLCSNRAGKAGRTVVMQTEGNLCMKGNVTNVFGTKTTKCMEWVNLLVGECLVEGFLSRPSAGTGRSSGDRQFFFINGRPVDMPKAAKLLNELYRSFNLRQYPIAIINFTLPTTSYDINVSPDKRKVLVHGEVDLLKGFVAALQTECAPFIRANSETKMKGPSGGQEVPPAVVPNEAGGESPGTDGLDSCGDTRQDGNVECEEVPIGATSSREYRNPPLKVPKEVPISATSSREYRNPPLKVPEDGRSLKLKPFRPNLTLKSFRRNSRDAILSTTSLTAGLLKTCSTEIKRNSAIQANLTGSVHRGIEDSEECDEILSTATLSADSTSSVPTETPSHGSVQARLPGRVSRFKRPLGGESEERSRLKKCWPPNVAAQDGTASEVEGVLQPENVEQGRSSKWCTLSSEASESDVHRRAMSSMLGAQTQEFEGSKCNSQGRIVKSPYFSSALQDELPTECPLLGTPEGPKANAQGRIVKSRFFSSACQDKLPRESPLRRTPEGPEANAQGRIVKSRYFSSAYQDEFPSEPPSPKTQPVTHGLAEESTTRDESVQGASELNLPGFEKRKQKPLLSEGSKQASSVLPFNRVVAPEASETVHRPQAATVIPFDIKRVQMLYEKGFYPRRNLRRPKPSHQRPFTIATVDDNAVGKTSAEKVAIQEAATKELEQNFNKADFKHMKVVGHFDKHFILARLNQDMFIVDQHNADEIYNFEQLMRTSVLDSQLLSRPEPLELDAVDEKIVKRHKEIFRKNGFAFLRIKEAPIGHKLQLSAVPSCTDGMLGVEDVKELISLVASRLSEDCTCGAGRHLNKCSCRSSRGLPRPSRVRAVLVSEACKLSKKIGDALGMQEMEEVVNHLAELEAPWTCPHGRPTIRHMIDLSCLVNKLRI